MSRNYVFFGIVLCFSLFMGGYFFGDKILTPKVASPETVIYSPPPPNPELDKANELRSKYIDGLGFHGDPVPGQKSKYLTTKEEIINAYNAGDRSLNLIRAYIYLAAQEGDFRLKEKILQEFCTTPEICREFMSQISVQGIIRDPQGKVISGAIVEVLGTAYKTTSNAEGKYNISFEHISPAVLRLQASSPNRMIGVNRIDIVDAKTSATDAQSFERDFILAKAFVQVSIDTKKKTIIGEGTSKIEKGYFVVTPYTKYLIPFDGIVKEDKPYIGKLKATIFEFDRQSSSYLLNADIFDLVGGLISQTLVTYGMPFVILTAEDGSRLDVLSGNPMTIWTTDRASKETSNLLLGKEYRELFEAAYKVSQEKPDEYPINSLWDFEHGNKKIVPLFWVFNRATGYWDNVGMRFVTREFTAPYNIEAKFYTIRSEQ